MFQTECNRLYSFGERVAGRWAHAMNDRNEIMKKIAALGTTLVLVIGLFATKVSAQTNVVTIRVIDNLTKKAIKDAKLLVRDSISSMTNHFGYAQIKAASGDTLLVSCIDYDEIFIIVPVEQKFQVGLDKKQEKLDFSGGIKSFYEHWMFNLKYSSGARSGGVQGDVYVEFRIDSTGHSNLIKIHNDTKKFFQQDIKRVFNMIKGTWSTDYSNKIFLLPIRYRIPSLQPPINNDFKDVHPDRILTEIVVKAIQY